jgi:hypothetical protein
LTHVFYRHLNNKITQLMIIASALRQDASAQQIGDLTSLLNTPEVTGINAEEERLLSQV